jgi:uncharacterized protein (DUF983 family)
MKCPKCNEEPISLRKYLSKFNFFKLKCQSCGTDLKLGTLLSVIFSFFIVGAMVIGFQVGRSLSRWSEGDEIYVVILIALVILGVVIEIFMWKYGRYEIKDS